MTTWTQTDDARHLRHLPARITGVLLLIIATVSWGATPQPKSEKEMKPYRAYE